MNEMSELRDCLLACLLRVWVGIFIMHARTQREAPREVYAHGSEADGCAFNLLTWAYFDSA
jgi:hypothetical protein